jgi:predicted phage baseplate assembly protein
MIPPGNARIAVTYRSGGGTAGNVPQRAISELRAAMPYIASATNLLPARGGAPVETLASLAARGPQRIRHRGRALAASDYEWLAREASTAVANARCLDVTAPDGRVMRGWVTVIVLPDDISPAPVPDAELLGRVRAYLAQRAPAGVSDRLSVGGPRYRVASVAADIVVRVGADPGEVETNVRDGLARFLHPVHGGPDDAGWSFGATLYVSQIARVIGRVAGVDRSSSLELAIDGLLVDDRIALRPDELPSSGTHRVRIRRAGSC